MRYWTSRTGTGEPVSATEREMMNARHSAALLAVAVSRQRSSFAANFCSQTRASFAAFSASAAVSDVCAHLLYDPVDEETRVAGDHGLYDALFALLVADDVLPRRERDGDRVRGARGHGAAQLRLVRDYGRGCAHRL
jgi:hypothetical protein